MALDGWWRWGVQCLATLVLLTSAGCSKADMSDARRDYLLAKDHGWLDLVVKAPLQAPGYDAAKACSVTLLVNGEPVLHEDADLARAEAGAQALGFRFIAPAGKLETELRFGVCVSKELVVALPFVLAKDHLTELAFDGKALSAGAGTPYAPVTLDWVKGEIGKLQDSGRASDAALSTLTKIAIASLLLNVLGLGVFVWLRRRS